MYSQFATIGPYVRIIVRIFSLYDANLKKRKSQAYVYGTWQNTVLSKKSNITRTTNSRKRQATTNNPIPFIWGIKRRVSSFSVGQLDILIWLIHSRTVRVSVWTKPQAIRRKHITHLTLDQNDRLRKPDWECQMCPVGGTAQCAVREGENNRVIFWWLKQNPVVVLVVQYRISQENITRLSDVLFWLNRRLGVRLQYLHC